jgi:hypothetical protein
MKTVGSLDSGLELFEGNIMTPAQKSEAHIFLTKLQSTLNSSLPSAGEVRKMVEDISVASKLDDSKQHTRYPESAFINYFIIPKLSEFIHVAASLSKSDARQALLAEGFRTAELNVYCSGSPARTVGHPFTKLFNATPEAIALKWTADGSLTNACPDFALRPPFPFKIVFEGKYFVDGSLDKARRDLVTNIYQAFFYRALPYVEAKHKGSTWDYDYSCLLAYDASEGGNLKHAWDQLVPKVKNGFWEGANVYVMILG